ncbi:MAG: phosphatase PAP2 family protein [Promethearchaeota archaeon]
MTEKQPEKYEPYYELTKKEILINVILTGLVLIIGIILLALGMNEAFYSESETMRAIFEVITLFGDEELYIVFFCVFYFGVNKKFAKRLIIGFLISLHLTDFFKNLFQDPRPPSNFISDPLGNAEGYGFPSGHTSGTLSFWGYTFFNFKGEEKKKQIGWRSFAMFLMVMVPISRLIIGVHDLQDIVGGFILGFLVINVYMYFEPKITPILAKWSWKKQVVIGLAVSIGLWILGSMMLHLIVLDPAHIEESIKSLGVSCGIMMGSAIAFPMEEEFVKYDPDKLDLLKTLLALLMGLVITFGLYFGLSALFKLAPSIYFITRAFKYCLLLVIAALGVPYIIKKVFKME